MLSDHPLWRFCFDRHIRLPVLHQGVAVLRLPSYIGYGFRNKGFAATTLPAAGFPMSTFDFAPLLLVGVAVFLLVRDFFSIAIVIFSRF
jgi:hypothetical protein